MPYRKITGIYQIKNLVNNKVYIGSAKSIMDRFSTHKGLLKNNKHFNNHLQAAYNKYGLEAFSFEILEVVELKRELIEEREEFNIQLYKANDREFGYNKRLKSNTNLGRKFSDEIKEKFRISHLGVKQSKETIEKKRISQFKEVYKIGEDKKIICKYKSIMDAAEKNNIHKQSISGCCRGILNSTGGFYWCFVADYEKKEFKPIKNNNNKLKSYIYENILTGEKYYKLKDVSKFLNKKNNLTNIFSGKYNLKNNTNFIRYEKPI